MIDLKTEQGRAAVAALFRKDMAQPALEFALYRSYRRWADLRDQLIDSYSKTTRLPHSFFEDLLIEDQAKALIG